MEKEGLIVNVSVVLKNPKMYVGMKRKGSVCVCVLERNSSDWTNQVFYDLPVSEGKQEGLGFSQHLLVSVHCPQFHMCTRWRVSNKT